jgi:hypothetical protein
MLSRFKYHPTFIIINIPFEKKYIRNKTKLSLSIKNRLSRANISGWQYQLPWDNIQ